MDGRGRDKVRGMEKRCKREGVRRWMDGRRREGGRDSVHHDYSGLIWNLGLDIF